jgi:2-iminoacetate synthase ThiH
VCKDVGVDINFNLQGTRDCYIHTQRQIEKSMQEYARLKCQELLLLVAEKANLSLNGEMASKTYSARVYNERIKLSVDKDSILNAVDLDKFIV